MSGSSALAYVFGGPLLGAQIDQSEQQRKAMKRSERDQREAARRVEDRAISQQRANDMAYAAANQKKPNINSLLADEATAGLGGSASTILTGQAKRKGALGATDLLGG